MSFGLTNAPAFFMDLMNIVVKQYMDLFVIVFIDNILIYSSNEEEHVNHLRVVLQTLNDGQYYSLCLFSVSFCCNLLLSLGIFCLAKGSECVLEKEVKQWLKLISHVDFRRFLGLAGHYRRFVEGFSFIASK